MIDFILAGIVYMGLMFVVLFSVSFATVGICFGATVFFRRCMRMLSPPRLALK